MEPTTKLPFDCTLELDSDGDWVIVPPAGLTIFSSPGEGVLIGRCDHETALADALAYLADIPALAS
jgi:hypothetical protein